MCTPSGLAVNSLLTDKCQHHDCCVPYGLLQSLLVMLADVLTGKDPECFVAPVPEKACKGICCSSLSTE